MDSENLSPQSLQTGSLGIFAALQEAGDSLSSINGADSQSLFAKHNASNTPSLAQQAALGVLLQLEPRVVLAWLTIFRSSKPGEFQTTLLSSHQVAALIELKDCPDSLVEVWLQDAHQFGTFAVDILSLELIAFAASPNATQVPQEDGSQQATCFSALTEQYNPTTDTTARDSTLSGTSTSFYGYSTGYSTPVSSYAPTSSYPSSLNEISSEGPRSFPLTSAGHPHGCPICLKDRSIGTCDGWKRHMKEHETLYPCNVCAASGKTRSYSRKINLLRHLETHGFSNDASSTLADTWKKTHEKKYFGCGFCVFVCTSLTEQLNHIDSEHFRNFRSISEWDTNKVIRGLLMQSDLSLIMQNLLGQPFGTSENLSWHPSIVHELQLRLQESNETTEDLARITVLHIDWDLTARNTNEPTSALSFGNTCQDAPALTSSHHQIGTVNDNHRLWTDLASPCRLTSTQHLQHHQHSVQSAAPSHVSLNVVNHQLELFNGQPNRARSNVNDHQQMNLPIESSSQSNNDHTQGTRHSLLPTWENRALRNVDERLNESVPDAKKISINGACPSTPFAGPINSTTTLCSTNPSYQHPVPSSVPRAAALGEELPPSTCSSGPTVARVLSLNAQLKKHRSRKKLVSHYGAPDLDFEELQYLMRDDDRSRSIQRQR